MLDREKGNKQQRVPDVFQPRCLSIQVTMKESEAPYTSPLHTPPVNEPVRKLCAPFIAVNLQCAYAPLFTFKYSTEFIMEIFTLGYFFFLEL